MPICLRQPDCCVRAIVRTLTLYSLLILTIAGSAGCATYESSSSATKSPEQIETDDILSLMDTANSEPADQPSVYDVYLSAGDEIRISVYGQSDLTRQIVIPPNGRFFYPLVGELQLEGRNVEELRTHIAETLESEHSHTLSPGDEITIKVYNHSEMDVQSIIPQDGLVQVPLAGTVNISGLTPTQAGEAVTKKIARYVKKPQVSVQVLQYQGATPISDPQVSIDLIRLTGEKYFVLGEVRQPGVFALSGPVRLLDAVAMAGGTLPNAKISSVVLMRPTSGRQEPESRILDLDAALTDGTLSENPRLIRGDVIFVPETALSKTSRIFDHFESLIRPFVSTETAIWLWQNIDAGPRRDSIL